MRSEKEIKERLILYKIDKTELSTFYPYVKYLEEVLKLKIDVLEWVLNERKF